MLVWLGGGGGGGGGTGAFCGEKRREGGIPRMVPRCLKIFERGEGK